MTWWPLLLIAIPAAAALFFFQVHRKKRAVPKEVLLARVFGKILDGERKEVLEEMYDLYHGSGQDPGVGLALGVLYRHLGKHQVAIRTHQSLANRSDLSAPLAALIYSELAADFLASGLLERARHALEKSLQLQPGDEITTRYGERVLVMLKDWDAAVKLVQVYGKRRGVAVAERIGLLRYEQGSLLWEEGRREEALAAFKKAVSVHPQCLPAYLGVSRYYRHQDKATKALNFLKKHEARFLNEPWLYFRELMKIAKILENHPAFLNPVHKHLETHGRDWRSRSILGTFYMDTGRYDEAADHLFASLEIAPEVLLVHQKIWSLMLQSDTSLDIFRSYQEKVSKDLSFSNPYECRACGFHAAGLLWLCPACHRSYSFDERKI